MGDGGDRYVGSWTQPVPFRFGAAGGISEELADEEGSGVYGGSSGFGLRLGIFSILYTTEEPVEEAEGRSR